MLTAQPTVSMSWVNTLLCAAERHGVDQAKLLARAGVAATQLSLERLPIDDITHLWRAAAELTRDPGFGLKAGSLVGPASFNVVSFIFQSCATLREAITLVQKFQRLISDGGRFQLIGERGASWLIYHPQQGELAFSPHQIEAVLAAVVSFSGWVSGHALVPRKVQFSHDQLGPLTDYLKVFQSAVDFNQAFSGLLLDNLVLDQALPQADVQLAAMHRAYAAERLAALSQASDFLVLLRQWLAASLDGGVPTREAAASHFGISDRVFARRLQGLGMSYSDAVDALRQDQARAAVSQSGVAFVEIASSLGFSQASAFNRAFKRWTGCSPGQWREQHQAAVN